MGFVSCWVCVRMVVVKEFGADLELKRLYMFIFPFCCLAVLFGGGFRLLSS